MSVKNNILVLILVSMILFPSCKKEVNLQFDDVNEFGIHVFNLLKEKKHSQLKELIINKNDYDLLLNESDLDNSIINRFRSHLLPDLLKIEEFNFIKERSYFFNVICDSQDIILLRVENNKNINPLSFNVSDVEIIYTCNGNSEERKIYVESIKTLDGWKIMSNIY